MFSRAAQMVFVLLAASAGSPAAANTYCVHDAGGFQSALIDAGSTGTHDGQDNTIHLAAGSYGTSGAPFTYGTLSGFALAVDGGWNSSCTTQDQATGATALDGGHLTQVLSIATNGDLTLRHLTIRNGHYSGAPGGGAAIFLNGISPDASMIFDSNVVSGNFDDYGGAGGSAGGLSVIGNGTVYIENSLFAGNSGLSIAALQVSLTVGTAYLTNNTISGNTNTQSNHAITSIGASTMTGHVSNTISYGNHGAGIDDYFLYGIQNVDFVHDDYTSIDGTPAAASNGNFIGVDPKFVGAGNYHLSDFSPLLDAGTPTPAGGLPAKDLEGNPRIAHGAVDLGAFENVDLIFASNFDSP